MYILHIAFFFLLWPLSLYDMNITILFLMRCLRGKRSFYGLVLTHLPILPTTYASDTFYVYDHFLPVECMHNFM
jgi:hypothetical protein